MTLGHIAVRSKQFEIIKFLHEKTHFDFNLQDNDGITILQEAEKRGMEDISEYLTTY